MQISRERLKEIITDELLASSLIRNVAEGNKVALSVREKSSSQRKRDAFDGYEELEQLANGITEDDIEEMNVNHGSDGKFSSEKSASCKSSYFLDKDRKRKGGDLSDENEAGRGRKKTGQGRYRCKDNSLKWEAITPPDDVKDASLHSEPVNVPQDMHQCAKLLQRDKLLLKRMKSLVAAAKKGGRADCPLSYDDAVKIINKLELATKGKAFDKAD